MAPIFRRRPMVLDIRLRFIDYAIEFDAYENVLNSLADGIRKVQWRIERARDNAMMHYEAAIIENMLGAAYVMCQSQITAITQPALQLLNETSAAHELRALGPRFDADYSKIEVLWALGNYFKHRDEWSPDTWDNPTGLSKFTVPVIKAAGLACGSADNLRRGAKALGNPRYEDVYEFFQPVRVWGYDVRERIRVNLPRP